MSPYLDVKVLRMKSNFLFYWILFILFSTSGLGAVKKAEPSVIPGIEVLVKEQLPLIHGKRIGLITNHTGVDRTGRHDIDILRALAEAQLVALFSPEHGIRGAAQAGEKVSSSIDARTGIPVHSLYGEVTRPTSEMLKNVDVLLYDIQDAGLRYYTYIFTMGECMKAAAEHRIPFIVLDRPNPLNGEVVDGKLLDSRLISAVSPYIIPNRYGLTAGELAQLIKDNLQLQLELHIIQMKHWCRSQWYDDTGLTWIPPSPNLPTLENVILYSGTCLVEGTNLSEGRGTEAPFEVLGAPWIKGDELTRQMNGQKLAGVRFSRMSFTPRLSKYSGQECQGVRIQIRDRAAFSPLKTALTLIQLLRRSYPENFKWNEKHFDRLAGSDQIRQAINQGTPVEKILDAWQQELQSFRESSKKYWLYP
jgi:uncharacterized protein YbbC (DUF1343 family)